MNGGGDCVDGWKSGLKNGCRYVLGSSNSCEGITPFHAEPETIVGSVDIGCTSTGRNISTMLSVDVATELSVTSSTSHGRRVTSNLNPLSWIDSSDENTIRSMPYFARYFIIPITLPHKISSRPMVSRSLVQFGDVCNEKSKNWIWNSLAQTNGE